MTKLVMLPILFTALLVASGSTASSGTRPLTAAGPAPATVRLATTSSIATVALLVMQGNGSLAKIGADFNTQFTLNTSLGSTAITTAFAAGQFDIMFQGLQHAPILLSRGQDAVQLMSIASGGGVYIVGTTKYQQRRGTDLKKWVRSNFGNSGVGSQTELWLDALLHGAGVVNYTKTPLSLDALYPTMLAGRIDGYAADVGGVAPALVNNTGYLLADSSSPAAAKLFGAPAPTVNMVTTRKFTDTYPQLTQALVTGLLSTVQNLGKPTTTAETVRAALPATNPYKNDAKTFAVIWKLMLPSIRSEVGVYTKARYRAIIGLLRASNTITGNQAPPPPSMIDNRFALQAYKTLKLDKFNVSVADGGRVGLTGAVGVFPGPAVFVVKDSSRTQNLRLVGPGINRSTGVAFRGTVTWKVTLRPGTYTLRSDRNKARGTKFTATETLG